MRVICSISYTDGRVGHLSAQFRSLRSQLTQEHLHTMDNSTLVSTTLHVVQNNKTDGTLDSPLALTTAAVGTAIAAAAILFSMRASRKKMPQNVPATRIQCLMALGNPTDLIPTILKWARHMGFPNAMRVSLLPTKPFVLVCDPDLARRILTDKATYKPAFLYKGTALSKGTSMLTQIDDVKWRHARKEVAPAFSSNCIKRMTTVCSKHAQRWVEGFLAPRAKQNVAFDPFREIMALTIIIICESALDYIASEEEVDRFLEDSSLVANELQKRAGDPTRAWLQHWLPDAKRAIAATQRRMQLGWRILKAHRDAANPTPGTVVDLINKNQYYESDDDRVRDINLFITAGYDTTAITITWILFNLAKHPQEMIKVQNALLKTPELERPSCPALKNAIQEGMRLSPAFAGGVPRSPGRDIDTGDGCTILKDSIVFFPQILTNRNPKVFGDDADVFRPDRWVNADARMKSALVPFALGPRNCIGQGLANAEIHTMLAMVLSQYSLELVQDCTPTNSVLHLPLNGKLRARQITNKD